MTVTTLNARPRALGGRIAVVSLITLLTGVAASAQPSNQHFQPGNLVVSRSVYDGKPSNVVVGTVLPPNCQNTTGGCSASTGATSDGTYPTVWNNNLYDGSFGITSRIYLDQLTQLGGLVNTLEVPNSADRGFIPNSDQMVTSFSSKSELALNLSTDGNYLTFMGYLAPIDALDVSNSNTPGSALTYPTVDPTNPVGESFYRAVAQVDGNGTFHFTLTDAYSGNNGRAAVLNNTNSANAIYTVGNAGNGGNPQPNGIILGAGAQIITPSASPESAQSPGEPTPVGSFNVTELGDKADKTGKDTNFRGLTVFNNVIYLTKGSGGNGVNTVYFIDTTGTACPNGVGLPSNFAVLPTTGIAYNAANLQSKGVQPYNMCILKGFNTGLAKTATVGFPFGVWFANATTLYVADEGDGNNAYNSSTNRYTGAAAQATAGLQKWVFNSDAGQWNLAYTLQAGLNLGVPYYLPGYPTGTNAATGLPWSPATGGLRNITGRVDENGTAIIFGITSTVSGNGDQGADPNKLVKIVDSLTNLDPVVAAQESFTTIHWANLQEVLRGVSLTPGTFSNDPDGDRD